MEGLIEKPAAVNNGLSKIHSAYSNPSIDYEQEFLEAMYQEGVSCLDSIISDSQIHRFASDGKGDKNCWYVFYGMAGAFGDWRNGLSLTWSPTSKTQLSPEEKKKRQEEIAAAKQAMAEEVENRHQETATKAQERWAQLSTTGHSPYLERKKVKPFGVRFGKGYIAIPLSDIDGKIWNLQRIFDEPLENMDTYRVFMKGARKKGCFHTIGTIQEDEPFYVCEGFATGSTVHMATGKAVVVAFDAGNIDPVVGSLREAYPTSIITIASDNDVWKHNVGNVGRDKAQNAAKKYQCNVVFPTFKNIESKPTDWNDLDCLEGLEEVRRQLEDKLEEYWSDPRPIKSELLPVEPLPLEIIPKPLQPWIQDIAYRMQCPLEHVAIPAMVMLGSIIGAGCGIRPKALDDWLIIPNLWGGIIGSPSTLKSPALAEALKPLAHLENKERKQFETNKEDHSYDLEAHKIAKEAQTSQIKKDLKLAKNASASIIDDIKGQLKSMEEPEQPTCKRFKTNDATIEKMTELLKENPKGILLFRDELMGLLASWEKDGHEADRAYYLEGWNGHGSHTVDRIGRGTTHCDNMCVSILGGTQPDKILEYFRKAIHGFGNDGFIQRLQVFVHADEQKSWKLVDQAPDKEAQKHVFQLAEAIASMNFTQCGAFQGPDDSIPYFHFSEPAQAVFCEWLTELETQKLRGDEESIIVEHLAKYRKLMPAFALIIHIVDIAAGKATGLVSLGAAEKAAAWCAVLESHARRIYGMATNYAIQGATNLSKKLKRRDLKDGFTVREIYRKEWSLLSDRESAQAACDELVEAGWLKEVVTDPAFGQKGKVEYLINPKIWR